jgi:MFS family permease
MSVDSKEGGSVDKRAIASKEDDDSVDKRVWPIAASTFITGSAVGVALPVMPLFAAELGLTTAEFGLVGSVFGGARLLSNLPMGVAVERFGRRPLLVLGPALAGTAMIGTGLSGSLPVLLGWRVLTGLGGSAQLTGAQVIEKAENV